MQKIWWQWEDLSTKRSIRVNIVEGSQNAQWKLRPYQSNGVPRVYLKKQKTKKTSLHFKTQLPNFKQKQEMMI